ncbi:MAG: hypothetical protein ACFFFK_04650 [Candidatus Thorarchaeota archaeon]
MNESTTVQLEKKETLQPGPVKRVLTILGLSVVWAFLSALTIGCLAASVWTAIPTEWLSWGASSVNLIGYVSHCPFVPISTFVLLGTSLVGLGLSYRLKKGRAIGKVVYLGTIGGLLIGLLGGIDIVMFMGMGSGLGIGVGLSIIISIITHAEV